MTRAERISPHVTTWTQVHEFLCILGNEARCSQTNAHDADAAYFIIASRTAISSFRKMTAMQTLLDCQFDDLENFLAEAQHWDLDFRATTVGGFGGRVKQLASPHTLISYACFTQGLHQQGGTPEGYRTFGLPGPKCSGFWWWGSQVTRDDMLVFPASNELRSVSHPNFEVFTISVRISYFEELIDSLGLKRPDTEPRVIHLNGPTADCLQCLAVTAVTSANSVAAMTATQDLVERLVVCGAQRGRQNMTPLRQRSLAVDRVVEYLRATPALGSDLAQLCHIASVSERTLQYAFNERYGMPPNAFVKRWKLNTARRVLLHAEPSQTTVTQVALDLGFAHPSQFATDYRRLFGELPSQTLRREAILR